MFRYLLILLSFWQFFFLTLSLDDALIIHTKSGFIKGVIQKTFLKHQKYLSFIGIPYAEPPIGDLRYKARHFSLRIIRFHIKFIINLIVIILKLNL